MIEKLFNDVVEIDEKIYDFLDNAKNTMPEDQYKNVFDEIAQCKAALFFIKRTLTSNYPEFASEEWRDIFEVETS